MDFKKIKIKKKQTGISEYIRKGFLTFILVFSFFLLLKLAFGVSIKNVIFFFGESLDTDKYGHTNILILGIGGGTHPGADLTDSIIAASIDEENKTTAMISIPRDIAVDLENIGKTKLNSVYAYTNSHYKNSEKALEITKDAMEEILGIPIHYYIKLNFSGFEKVIDSLGGLDLYIDQTINDPFFPKDGTELFEPFYIEQGWRHLNGKTALKYARSRETTSGFDRNKRQQKIIMALKDKLTKKGLNENKIEDIFLAIKNDVETNLSIREIITLAEIGLKLDTSSIKSYVLHDDPAFCGGWLTPTSKEEFNGAYMLIPAGDKYNNVHNLTNIVFNNARLINKNYKIQILNGTKRAASAKIKSILTRNCFDIIRFGNALNNNLQKTMYYVKGDADKDFVYILQKLIPGKVSTEIPFEYLAEPYKSDANVIIEIGNDYWANPMIDPYDYIVLPQPKKDESEPAQNEEAKTDKETKTTDANKIKQ